MRRDVGEDSQVWQFRRAWAFMQVGMILTLAAVDVWSTALSYVFFLLGTGAWFASESKPVAASAALENLPNEMPGLRYTRFARSPEPGAQRSGDRKSLHMQRAR